MIDSQRKYRQKREFVIREVEGEFLLIPINLHTVKLDTAFVLGATGAMADCRLLLDVNNVYVNAFNHKHDAKDYFGKLPLDKRLWEVPG